MSVHPIPDGVNVDTLHPAVVALFKRKQWTQRTPPWYEVRRGLITASDAAAALGVPPFKSYKGDPRKDVLLKKLENAPVRGMALVHGVKYEQEASDMGMRVLGETSFEFGLLVHEKYPWLAASPDGITSRGFAVEIKCPTKRQIVPGEIPHHYYPQVQVQMEVCDVPATYFIQYKPAYLNADQRPFVDIVVIERDRKWFADNVETLRSFWQEYMDKRDTHVSKYGVTESLCSISDDLYT